MIIVKVKEDVKDEKGNWAIAYKFEEYKRANAAKVHNGILSLYAYSETEASENEVSPNDAIAGFRGDVWMSWKVVETDGKDTL